jgi:hypothetical protein
MLSKVLTIVFAVIVGSVVSFTTFSQDKGEAKQGAKCTGTSGCSKKEFCNTAPKCGKEAPGMCAVKPEICTEEFKPVIGCDGKQYSNACKAHSAGISVKDSAEKSKK